MESLMSSRIQLGHVHYSYNRLRRSLVSPAFASTLVDRVLFKPTVVMKSHKPFNSVIASVQPLEASVVGRFDNTLPNQEVLEVWRNVDALCFDVDSTVCTDEGIDELTDFCGVGEAVAKWTARVMSGSVYFEPALAARLSLFNPSLAQLKEFLDKRPPSNKRARGRGVHQHYKFHTRMDTDV